MSKKAPAKNRAPAGGEATRFKPGQSGNPKGREPGSQNKATKTIKAFSQGLFNRPAFQRELKRQWDNMTLDPGTRHIILYWAFGRPPASVDVTASFDVEKYLARVVAEQDGVLSEEDE